jgi:tetratricopeptide (TPR) repeat protein
MGWVADLFRLAWGLLYWNMCKTWFRLRRGLAPAPCQSPSDSGRPFETQCEACIGWHRPARFKRVCPLLVATPAGLRCSVDAREVRPFWGLAIRYFGGAAVALYVAGVLAVFLFLRAVGYPVSIAQVGLPPLWPQVGQARGWFFLDRSNRAFAAGDRTAGLLYLANAYAFDPANYAAGMTLAKNYQAGQPALSDEVFDRLRRDHPGQGDTTAQDWYRALLARGGFDRAIRLAREELARGSRFPNAWMRALLFATEQTGDNAPLEELLRQQSSVAAPWRELLEAELLVRTGRTTEARALLDRASPEAPPYALFRRVGLLITLGDPVAALDLLGRHPGVLDVDADTTLRLEAYWRAGAVKLRQALLDALLASRLDPPRLVILCAHLIRHPDPALFERVYEKLEREPLALDNDTAGVWFSMLCTAGAVGDRNRLHELTHKLKVAANSSFLPLGLLESFFRGETAERRITTFLPMIPLPLEVTYALIERYSPPATRPKAA